MTMIGWAIDYETGQRVWSGVGTISLPSPTPGGAAVFYTGLAGMIEISAAVSTLSAPGNRLSASFSVANDLARYVLTDFGPELITVYWIYSNDDGRSWSRGPQQYTGRLSAPEIINGTYKVELEVFYGDVDRGRKVVWNKESIMNAAPAGVTDTGGGQMQALADGLEIRWPT